MAISPNSPELDFILSPQSIKEDLDFLETTARQRHSYFTREQDAFLATLQELREQAKQGLPKNEFVIALALVLATLQDGHARIYGDLLAQAMPKQYLPFIIDTWQQHCLALNTDRRLLSADFPFVQGLDGLPLEQWLDASSSFAQQGIAAKRAQSKARRLEFFGYFRHRLGLRDRSTVQVELKSLLGQTRTLELPLGIQPMQFDPDKTPLCRVLEGNIGCIRITGMEDDQTFLESLIPAMHKLRSTTGLIIDVRGNPGGTRHALRTLFPFFLQEGEQRLYTVAAVRIPDHKTRDNPEGYLQDRFLHPITASLWNDQERLFVTHFAENFKPTWTPPENQFSAFHYGLLPRTEAHFYYPHQVIVLMDVWCASATDVFLGAFKGWRNITLMGKNSMGASGRPGLYTMPNSGIEFLMSSMASYRPDGHLYEKLGIQPDIELEPTLEDFIHGTDSMLEKARTMLVDNMIL